MKKKPIQIIREMNPSVFIPSGAQLARMLKSKKVKPELAPLVPQACPAPPQSPGH